MSQMIGVVLAFGLSVSALASERGVEGGPPDQTSAQARVEVTNSNSCPSLLQAESPKNGIVNTTRPKKGRFATFLSEVKSTRGLRLILKDARPYSPWWRGGGFLRVTSKGYRLSIGHGLYQKLLNQPVWSITQRWFGRPMEPALFLSFPALLVGSYLFNAAVSSEFVQAVNDQTSEIVSSNAHRLDEMIESDFRFHEVAADLAAGKISLEQARREGYFVNLAYNEYYAFMNSEVGTTLSLQKDMELINQYLFIHLRGVIEHGVAAAPGFFVADSSKGQLSDQQKLHLFEINHELYADYEIISEMFINEEITKSPRFRSILADPFRQAIMESHRQNKISDARAIYLLQQDAFWKTRFEEWRTIGVVKLKIDSHGRETTEPLTLEEVRSENLKIAE